MTQRGWFQQDWWLLQPRIDWTPNIEAEMSWKMQPIAYQVLSIVPRDYC